MFKPTPKIYKGNAPIAILVPEGAFYVRPLSRDSVIEIEFVPGAEEEARAVAEAEGILCRREDDYAD